MTTTETTFAPQELLDGLRRVAHILAQQGWYQGGAYPDECEDANLNTGPMCAWYACTVVAWDGRGDAAAIELKRELTSRVRAAAWRLDRRIPPGAPLQVINDRYWRSDKDALAAVAAAIATAEAEVAS